MIRRTDCEVRTLVILLCRGITKPAYHPVNTTMTYKLFQPRNQRISENQQTALHP
jgi:hypothetical protein